MIHTAVPMIRNLESKPRVCGDDPYPWNQQVKTGGVNPACAGMIQTAKDANRAAKVVNPACAGMIQGFLSVERDLDGVNPACAGMIPRTTAATGRRWP